MKSFVKKVMVVAIVLATVVDWPVEIGAFNARPIAKGGATLLKSCSRYTKAAEENVNKATQAAEKEFHPTPHPAVANGTNRIIDKVQSHWVTCFWCNGTGILQGNDGFVYSCNHCKGTGKIFVK